MTHSRVLVLALIALMSVSTGCAKLLGPKATKAALELRAAETLNPDDSDRPSPLRLRLYELKSVSAFNSADFNSLYQRDKEVLGGNLVALEEIQVQPGMQKSFTRTLSPDTKVLAVLAPYRKIEQAGWRASIDVPPGKTTPLVLDVGSLAVSLTPPPKKK
ncbi:MAG TPA: type VI secretion system lipoprotein TssJ [Burkholderiales bacterium]|nr:type VI secretion system lipoprotein TssJ [Burkholderiales bacterium]